MAEPVRVSCPEGEWKKVATNVITGQVKKINGKPYKYLETYRMTGSSAPALQTEGVTIFLNTNSEEISASAAIDVYIMAVGEDGEVRVDIP